MNDLLYMWRVGYRIRSQSRNYTEGVRNFETAPSGYGLTRFAVNIPLLLRKNILFATLIIVSAVVLLSVTSCSNGKSDTMSDDNRQALMTLFRQGKDAAMKKDFRRSDSLGNVLLHQADIYDNDECRVRGMMCRSYSMVDAKDGDRGFRYLLKAEKLLGNINNDTLTAEFYNLMGVMAFHDFDRSKEYWKRRVRLTPSGTRDLTPRAKQD